MAAKRTQDDSSCFPGQKKRKVSSYFGSSFSSSTTQPWSYDVFLSFRGEDTRKNFTDHLYAALAGAGIHTFRDDEELPRGPGISSELLKSIEESRISIVVFSRNYASSRWCLDELVKIIECKTTIGQLILPIFYNVDPSQVRNQTGCFAEAFERHQKHFVNEMQKVESWRAALTEAANLSGYDLQNVANGHEAKFIQKIVEDVSSYKVNHTFLNVALHPVGIDSRVKHIEFLLSIGLDDVRMIGIYGLGGIGKTTIAKAVYNRIFLQFEGSCFLANIREVTGQQNGLVQLQKQLLSELLRLKNLEIGCVDRGKNLIKERLHSKRVLIVLDDLHTLSQLNSLAGNRDWFGLGSIIIITTRDDHLLKDLKKDETYMVEELNHAESVQLFSWHAFKRTNPLTNYAELADGIVRYAGGLPLALKVLGSNLYGRNMLEWKSAFDKLQQIPHNEIQKKLRISFDALDDDKMKDIFLDIACFFIGMDKDYAITILDGCGFFSEYGISVLINRCLLRIDYKNKLTMHDLLRDMGREIVREESPKELGERSRLWFHEDVCNVLGKNKGSKKVEGIMLTLPMLKKIQWGNKAFARMPNLRLLQINHVHLSGNFEHLFEELRWLCWHNCPWKYLPSNFHPEKLVVLDIQFSKIITLWQDGKYLKSLKILNLSNSKWLTKSFKFDAVPRLEKLLLESCPNFMEIHESIGLLDRLVYLSLKDCTNLKYLPDCILQLSIKHLNLTGCTKLEELQEHLGHRRLPTKSWLSRISSWISFLPTSISSLCFLRKLVLTDCNLSEGDFRVDLGSLSSLKKLDLSRNNFRRLPYSVSHLSMLENLHLDGCTSLQSISNLPSNLKELYADGCTSLEKISTLPNLRCLLLISYLYNELESNDFECPVKELQCFQGAPIIPKDRSNNILYPFQYPRAHGHNQDHFSPGCELSDYLSLQIPGSSICFEVPVLVNSKDLVVTMALGAVFTVEDECSMELTAAPYAIIRDKTNGVAWTYTPFMYAIPRSGGEYVWRSAMRHESFGHPIEGGEQLEVSFITQSPLIHVKKCGIRLTYFSEEQSEYVSLPLSLIEEFNKKEKERK